MSAKQSEDDSLILDHVHDGQRDASVEDRPGRNLPTTNDTQSNTQKLSKGNKGSSEEQQSRDASLRQELTNVRMVNEAIEGVISSLERARSNMTTVNQTVNAASTLLNTWSRILSQTEHSQRLILDPSWQGASHDVEEMERETVARQHAAQRREVEEQERRVAAVRRAEEEERKRAETANNAAKIAGRGRSSRYGARTPTSSSTGYVASGGTANTSTSSVSHSSSTANKRGSGISRGTGYRGRGRGS